jgi:hypothetical protein
MLPKELPLKLPLLCLIKYERGALFGLVCKFLVVVILEELCYNILCCLFMFEIFLFTLD